MKKWGNPILDESEISICLTGFKERAFPTMIEMNTVLMSTNDKYLVPSWEQFMSVDSEKDLINLKPSNEKKVKSFALLPSFLMRILLHLTKHFPRYYLLSFIKSLKQAIKIAKEENNFDNLERVKLFHDTFVFLWGLDDEKISKHIKRSKSRSLTSKLLVNWADKVYKKNLISEIEDINRNEVLTQLSQEESSVELVHDLDKFDQEYKEKNIH